jgi:hypothetical protein
MAPYDAEEDYSKLVTGLREDLAQFERLRRILTGERRKNVEQSITETKEALERNQTKLKQLQKKTHR